MARVERALAKEPGVLGASVNLATERATVTVVPGLTDASRLAGAVRAAGYDAFLVGEHLMTSADPAAALRALLAT